MTSEELLAEMVREGIEPEEASRMVTLLDNQPSEAEMCRVVDGAKRGQN